MTGLSGGLRRLSGVLLALSMVGAWGGVAVAAVDDDLALAMQGVERGLRAAEAQRASLDSGVPDSRITRAVAVVDELVAARIVEDPTLAVDDVLQALVSEVPETGTSPGPLGEALDAAKRTGQELAEEQRSEAPGQADEGDVQGTDNGSGGNSDGSGDDDAGSNGNAAGGGNEGGNAGGGGNGGDNGNAGGGGNGGDNGNAGGGGNGGENGDAGENGNAGDNGNAGENGNAGSGGNVGGNANGGGNGNGGGGGNQG